MLYLPTTLTRMIDYNVILQKLKAFQTKYGNDFDANLGKLNLLAECEKALKTMLMYLCDDVLQSAILSNRECSGVRMLIAMLQNYGTITMLAELSDQQRLQ